MQLRFFIVDQAGQIRKVSRDSVESLWSGQRTAAELECSVDDQLRLMSVLCDEDLLPVICYFARLQLTAGVIAEESRIEAFEAISMQRRRRYDHPLAQRQLAGWPKDWQHQLAVALDVPVAMLNKIGVGGPLLMSELWGVPLDKVLEYFEEAAEE
jgi:hypothetical protein